MNDEQERCPFSKPTFSVNHYDRVGDIVDEGVFLHFGDTRIKVCDTPMDFEDFIDHLHCIHSEIAENYLR
jgi:hypothetical protein